MRASDDLEALRRLFPSENGVTVFDAETQETSYGIARFDGMPFIFDTHRKDGRFVSTIELLTEVVRPIPLRPDKRDRFLRACRSRGLLPIPYSGCFFKGNLHVYAFFGPVRGFDVSGLGVSVADAEDELRQRMTALWPAVPNEILRAQADLLNGRRKVRHAADLEVLVRSRR